MPLVFVHGVATRQTPAYVAETAQRVALFKRLVFNSNAVKVFNPDWGTYGVIFSPDLPWLPRSGEEAYAAGPGARSAGDVDLSAIAKRDGAQAVDLLVFAALSDAAAKAGDSDDLSRQREALELARASADFVGAKTIGPTGEIKGTPELEGGSNSGFGQALAFQLNGVGGVTQAYGGGLGQAIQDAVSVVGGWVGNGLSDVVLRAKRADLSRGVAYFLGDVFVYLRQRDVQGPQGDASRLFAPIVRDLIAAWKAPRSEREPFVVVGHSLGAVLLYDILTDPGCLDFIRAEAGPDFKIDLLLTVGAQPGFFKDLRMYEKGEIDLQAKLPTPKPVSNWFNVLDYTDVFSFTCAPFFESVEDFGYDSVVDVFQAHTAYFKRPSFYKRTQLRLQSLGFL